LAGTQAAVRLESEDGRLLTLVAPPGPDGLTLVAVRATALAARQDSAALRLLADSLARAADAATGAARAVAPYVAGLAAQLAGAHDTAVVRLGAALAVSRTAHPLANIALARSLVTLGRAGEAVAALRPALRADPYARGAAGVPFPIVREQLAYAHLAAGARDSARVHARVALEAWTEGEPLWRARALALRRSVGLVRRPAADSGAAPTPGAQLE
jgi:tetratricopeptide (TPR) repeat protein